MKKKTRIMILLIVIIIIVALIVGIANANKSKTELVSIKSEDELMKIYEGEETEAGMGLYFLTMPISGLYSMANSSIGSGGIMSADYSTDSGYIANSSSSSSSSHSVEDTLNSLKSAQSTTTSSSSSSSSSTDLSIKEHSTTNIQVENVDEADIVKTDGDYIYSISGQKVVITNVKEPTNIEKMYTITLPGSYYPEDLILYNNKLVIISTDYSSGSYSNKSIYVTIYDLSRITSPKKVTNFILYENYYTSRCIDGKLFIISSGYLKKEDDKIVTYYWEDGEQKEIGLDNIKYIKGLESKYQTLIATFDLNSSENVKVNSYLFNIENAYISEENMYLLSEEYEYGKKPTLGMLMGKLFGFGGIPGLINYISSASYSSDEYTHIYKFNIQDNGSIEFQKENKIKGTTINQFSLDEKDGDLRIGLYTPKEGSRIAVLDNNLQLIGETEYLAAGEKMYSTRFIGNKAYMVTYRNTDPLYVIDLSSPEKPTVLGELKIPGYSTYLHPYDDTHLIGIGMQTEETVNRNSSGKIISTTAKITGMKMALFDVSDVNNPVQISQTIIGDSRTTSAILTNHKALLFSKEKGIIAIPVNTYPSDFSVSDSSTNISSMVSSYKNSSKDYISEGYLVYNINLTDGFTLKGIINHEKTTTKYSYYGSSKLIRGMWIEDNLYTVSENMITVNKLDNLEEISKLKIGGNN